MNLRPGWKSSEISFSFGGFKKPFDLASHSNLGSESSYETNPPFGHTC